MTEKLTPTTRNEMVEKHRRVYKTVTTRREKSEIISQVVGLGYDRKYAIKLLNQPARQEKEKGPRVRHKHYPKGVCELIMKVHEVADMNSKALKAMMDIWLPSVVNTMPSPPEPWVVERASKASASTIERILRQDRETWPKKIRRYAGNEVTKSLKQVIPVRTHFDRDTIAVGHMEIDTVRHCGGQLDLPHLATLNMVDIASAWCEFRVLLNNGSQEVTSRIQSIRNTMPFELLSIDSDNGSEFINHTLHRYCIDQHIPQTRCRPYQKNDQCYVEQKNRAIIRKALTHRRLRPEQLSDVQQLLHVVSKLYNYFTPTMLCTGKLHVDGQRVKRIYGKTQTPLDRLAELKPSEAVDMALAERSKLNPVDLARQRDELFDRICAYSTRGVDIAV